MSFLGVLGGIGSAVSNEAESRRQEQEQRKREEEMARKEKMDAFMKMFSLVDPEAKLQLLQTPDAQIAFGKNAGTVRDSFGRGIAQQQQAKMRGEGVAQLQQDIQSQVGAPDVPEGSAEMLYDAGKAGRGLDAIMNINRTIQNKQDARMSNRVNKVYDDAVASGNRAKMVSASGQLKTMGYDDKAKELMQIADTLPTDDAKLEKTDVGDVYVFTNPYTGEEVKRIAKNDGRGGSKKLGQVQEQKLDAIKTLDAQMNIANSLLGMDEVTSSIGPFSGTINRFKQNNPMLGSVTGRPPIAFSTFQSTLVNAADAFLRMRTGAAAQDQEIQRIMNQIVGDVTLDPETLRAMFKTFQQSLDIERQAIEGGRSEPVDITTALLELQQIASGQVPKTLAGAESVGNATNDAQLRLKEIEKRKQEIRAQLGGQ